MYIVKILDTKTGQVLEEFTTDIFPLPELQTFKKHTISIEIIPRLFLDRIKCKAPEVISAGEKKAEGTASQSYCEGASGDSKLA